MRACGVITGDAQEIKYIEKIAKFVDGDTTKLLNLL